MVPAHVDRGSFVSYAGHATPTRHTRRARVPGSDGTGQNSRTRRGSGRADAAAARRRGAAWDDGRARRLATTDSTTERTRPPVSTTPDSSAATRLGILPGSTDPALIR